MKSKLVQIIESFSYIGLEMGLFIASIGFLLALVFSPSLSEKQFRPALLLLLAGLLFVLVLTSFSFEQTIFSSDNSPIYLFQGLFVLSKKAILYKQAIAIGAILLVLHLWSMKYSLPTEFFVLFLAAIASLFFLLMANHWLSLYLSIEFVSICSYLLVAIFRQKVHAEAGIKYLLVGAISSAVMLYGISFLYGLTGRLDFMALQELFSTNQATWTHQVALFLGLAGLFFKLSAAPFHTYTPDVYEATPAPIASFLAILPKIATLFVIKGILTHLTGAFVIALSVVILLSWIIGNFSALWQKNTKRMLGYSAIAQSGFILVALTTTQSPSAERAIEVYLFTYMFISINAFLLIDLLARTKNSFELDTFKGIASTNKMLGVSAVIISIALIGLPPTIGFTGKLLVFSSIWEEYGMSGQKIHIILLLFGLLNAAISLFYYIKIPYYLIVPESEEVQKKLSNRFQLAEWYCFSLSVFLVYLFFFPKIIYNWLLLFA
ncbi:MAG: NADH-quinone oxidoreductase subunit N [Spirosomataceae bacterium]